MDVTKLKRQLARCDGKQLGEIIAYCRSRKDKLVKDAWAKSCAEAWERARHWQVGQTVYCCASGTFIGGPLQRGDSAIVHSIQPRKKVLWVKIKGEYWGFPVHQVNKYDLRDTPPDNPMDETERKFANTMGNVANSVGLGMTP